MSSPVRKSTARDYFESIVIAVILALFIRTWGVQAFKIPTGSMEQNLLIGDHLLVNKFVFGPTAGGVEQRLLPVGQVARGDILVFKFPEDPERDFIKRVIGLPGETFELRGKQVYIDGELVDEPYLRPEARTMREGMTPVDGRDNYGPLAIPEGHYFMMGDNRDNSQDSRYWGPLPHGHVKGKAMMIYWSYDARPPLIGTGESGLRRAVGSVGRFFTGTRWGRMFSMVD